MIALAAVMIAGAVFVIIPPTPEPRLHRLMRTAGTPRARLSPGQRGIAAALVAAIASLAVFGFMPGVPMAVIALVVMPRLLGRLETAESRRAREALDRQLPDALDVLTSLLESGAPATTALRAVGHALGPPIGPEFERVSRALGLGADPAQAWGSTHPSLRPLAAAMIRSAETGAPMALVIAGVSSDARREHRSRVEIAARSAGVKAVAPLAACFLPAFFLMGVAPIIASFVEQLLHS